MRLREIRKARGRQQKELAEKIGTDEPMMSKFENYKCLPIPSMMRKLLKELGCSRVEENKFDDYFKINKLSNGNDIKALRDVSTRYNVQPADSKNLEFQLESGGNIYGVKLGDTVASAEQADVKKYMYSAYGRKPQAGDLCYYAGQIVIVCQNGNLRYLKDAPNFLGTWNWWGVKHLEELVNSLNVDYD